MREGRYIKTIEYIEGGEVGLTMSNNARIRMGVNDPTGVSPFMVLFATKDVWSEIFRALIVNNVIDPIDIITK